MEENNDFKNPENVENSNNVDSNNNQPQKSPKAKKVIAGVTCVVVVAGVITGVILNRDKIFKGEDKSNTSLVQSKDNSIQENKVEETKITKKIDESKPWVYDADYGKDNEEKKLKPQYSNEIYNTIDMLRIPYININSDDAKNVNNELKNLYDELYNSFGKNGETVMESSYTVYNHSNILSIVIKIDSGVLNGGKTHEYKTYSFNLETLKKADMFEVAQKCGFKSKEDLNKAIDNSLLQAKKELSASENATRNDDIYYITNYGGFNTMVLSMSELGYVELRVETSMIDAKNNQASSNQTTQTNTEDNKAISEIKKCLKDENWLKQNIYITESEMIGDDANTSDQQINFIVCKSNTKPIIVVETSSDNARFIKIDLITYENNKVTVKRINQGHIYHGGYNVDANKCVVRSNFMHMGTYATILHSIVDGKISLIGSYSSEEYFEEEMNSASGRGEYKHKYFIEPETDNGPDKEVTENEYKEHKKNLNEEQYSFVSINTPLTNNNVDTYIK